MRDPLRTMSAWDPSTTRLIQLESELAPGGEAVIWPSIARGGGVREEELSRRLELVRGRPRDRVQPLAPSSRPAAPLGIASPAVP